MNLYAIFEQWFLLFLVYSVLGWVWESVFCSLWTTGHFVNRGFLNGPYCPIYGYGALLDLILLGRVDDPLLLLFISGSLCCLLEYFTSVAMEKLFHARWWDYSHMRFHINGRICLLGFLAFGAFSVVLIRFVNPLIVQTLTGISKTWIHFLTAVTFIVFMADNAITFHDAADLDQKYREIQERLVLFKRRMAAFRNTKENTESFFRQMLSLLSGQQQRLLHAFPSLHSLTYPHVLKALQAAMHKSRVEQRTNSSEVRHSLKQEVKPLGNNKLKERIYE